MGTRRSAGGRRFGWQGVLIALAVLPFVATVGLTTKGAVERREGLCVSCHTSAGAVLHGALDRALRASPPTDLAGAHRQAEGAGFTCAACHGGHDLASKSVSLALAARDLVHQALWTVEEPDALTIPLGDAVCARCHAAYRPPNRDAFHAIDAHASPFPVACTACHGVHRAGGRPDLFFLVESPALAECRRCHPSRELSLAGEYETMLSGEEADALARASRGTEPVKPAAAPPLVDALPDAVSPEP